MFIAMSIKIKLLEPVKAKKKSFTGVNMTVIRIQKK